MRKPQSTVLLLLLFFINLVYSQDLKFGKVSKEELQEKYYPLDSSANAAYLYNKRRTYTAVYGNSIKLVTDIQVRMKIYNKEGFGWAEEEINLYGTSNSNSEDISGLKAVTYNLENGQIVETKLDKKDVFKEQKSNNWAVKKFTMPNLKEGSVVEWKYRVISPYYYYIDDVIVQHEIPTKKLEASIQLLEYFYFNKRQKGYYFFKITESSKNNIDLGTNDKTIEINEVNIPAIKKEPYVNSITNYTAALQLEVASLSAPTLGLFENFTTTWEEIAKDIYKNSSFGGELKRTGHLKDDIAAIKTKYTSMLERVAGTFNFVKNNIKWNGNYSKYPEKGLKKAYDEHNGNSGDVNLTLVAMLKKMGVKANPVLVSTRNNGIPLFPTNRGFNYVIAAVETPEGILLLDATEPYSLPNALPLRVLNWQGRIVREDGSSSSVNLFPSKYSSKKVMAKISIDEDAIITGFSRTSFEGLMAMNYRNNYNKLSEDELIEQIEKDNQNIELEEATLANNEAIGKPLLQNIKFESDSHAEIIGDKIYFSPLFYLTEKENPFKLDKREFPVDFGAPWLEKYTISIKIPEGYIIESKPENTAFVLPEDMGAYKFVCIENNNTLQILSETKINLPIINPMHYAALKEFYKMMIDKQLEKVVLTKQ